MLISVAAEAGKEKRKRGVGGEQNQKVCKYGEDRKLRAAWKGQQGSLPAVVLAHSSRMEATTFRVAWFTFSLMLCISGFHAAKHGNREGTILQASPCRSKRQILY